MHILKTLLILFVIHYKYCSPTTLHCPHALARSTITHYLDLLSLFINVFFLVEKSDILNYLKSFHKCFNEEVTRTLTGETIIWSFFFNMEYLLVLRSFLIRELKIWSKMKYCNKFTVRKKNK